MAVIYGVLRGKLDRWKREDPPPGFKKSPHLQVRLLDGQGKPWRVPVNVRSGDPAKSLVIFHRADPLLSHPILEDLTALPSGLTDLNHKPRSASNALDYSRAPLFDLATGIALPPSGPGKDDDLQDVVGRQLNDLKALGGDLFAFGSHFHDPAPKPGIDTEFGTKDGMHDIHMNQGNAPHEHDEDNGVFNDGGLILQFPDHVTGLFFRFKTQFLPTDAHGNRIPGVSKEIPPAQPPVVTPPVPQPGEPHPTLPSAYVERALVNPSGDDPGKEVVVIGNTTLTTVDLTGWSIVDKNGAADALAGVLLPAGGSVRVVLSGNGAQLSNNGGTIRLLNPAGVLIHAVSYSKADAIENRFVRFNT
ncbi:MAG: hypothetical protein C5B57_02930 [Blastocatellia bacterium]|nr:MAG: hypothetical protein C5B57_02930 [Blastocatellia bacterium]